MVVSPYRRGLAFFVLRLLSALLPALLLIALVGCHGVESPDSAFSVPDTADRSAASSRTSITTTNDQTQTVFQTAPSSVPSTAASSSVKKTSVTTVLTTVSTGVSSVLTTVSAGGSSVGTSGTTLSLTGDSASILAQMTLEEKVGQMFLPRCPAANGQALIRQYTPAGYVLYARDFDGKTADQVRQTLQGYQQASKIPLLLAVDEEGGSVVRISRNPALRDTPFLSPQALFQKGGLEEIVRDTREKSRLLLRLGVNLNLAPVCDLSVNPDDYIYKRTFGQPAAETAEYIAAVVRTMEEEGISGALKHFPGYGNNRDTHTDVAHDNRPYSQFTEEDFLPFIAGIRQGAPSVLVSHNIVACMDPAMPASLSKEVHRILRETLHFDGVIMTDDLSMGAIKQYLNNQSPAVAAVLAGNDLLLTSDWETDYAALLKAVRAGEVSVSQIDSAVERILRWKTEKGLLPGN